MLDLSSGQKERKKRGKYGIGGKVQKVRVGGFGPRLASVVFPESLPNIPRETGTPTKNELHVL